MSSLKEANGQEYWRSLDQIADTDEFRRFMHHEFPAGAAELLDGDQRRHFLKIMAASMALAGLGLPGCRRWPEEMIAPYAKRPAGRVPGVPEYFATALSLSGVVNGVLATVMDGRPIKVDGNPEHPVARGGSDAIGQARILDLYDPDRSRTVKEGGEVSSFGRFSQVLRERLVRHEQQKGAGLALLVEPSSSTTAAILQQQIKQRFPQAGWHVYEPINNDEVVRGSELTFGSPHRPEYDLSKAKVIVALDSDFMFDAPGAIKNIRDFAKGRRADDAKHSMNRLYCFESALTLTGANADERAAVRSADVAVIAAQLAGAIVGDAALLPLLDHPSGAAVLTPEVRSRFDHALRDLQAHKGESVVVVGRRQPAEVHALGHMMNAALGNVGHTVAYAAMPAETPNAQSLAELAADMDAGAVETLIIVGGNPVYDAPADLAFADRLAKVGFSAHCSEYEDETSLQCNWHVNRANELETWGDGRAADGTFSIRQPMIMPLFGGKSDIELLALIADDPMIEGAELVRRNFDEMTGSTDDDRLWRRTLHDGFLSGSADTAVRPRVRPGAVAETARLLTQRLDGVDRSSMEAVFAADYTVYDGRFANNGWLQELPDPISKLTWDNAALCGTQTAADLGLSSGDMIRVTVDARSVETAVMVVPGQAEGCVTLPLGYGRGFGGRICTGAGFDFYKVRSSNAMGFAPATIQKMKGSYPLATTQDHHSIDVESVGGRGLQRRLGSLVREATLQEYREHPDFVKHRTHVVHRLSLWDETNLEGAKYKWGMSIDLSTCVGCNACVVACQAENNIPIVGKDQVLRGREMHWIRVDRYFQFGRDADGQLDPAAMHGVAMQPVPCMQCENAPCEQVCPVAATVHDESGLNVMVYNRCIGTRYCSNNCPYKVRRFNYYDFHRREPYRKQPGTLLQVKPSYYTRQQAAGEPLEQLQYNPEVSVRVRGVMEKCTYCTQRIEAAKIEAKNSWVKLPEDDPRRADVRVPIEDGAIVTACQQACPAEAIVFGDLNDPNSAVAKQHRSDRNYQMLEEINTKARTTYLAKLTNPVDGAPQHSQGSADTGHH